MSTKQILYALAILVVLAVIFGVWASYTKPITTTGEPTSSLGGTLSATGDFAYTEDKPYYRITASYPAKTGLQATADAKARATVEQGLAGEIATFKADSRLDMLTAQDAEIQGLDGDRKYALDMQYKAYSSTTTVSYVYQVYSDTLGAHPNAYYLTYTFDQDGNLLKLADVLDKNPNWLEELSLLVSQDVTTQLKARLGQYLPQGDEGPDVTGAIFAEGLAAQEDNFKNFALSDGDLLILIPPYQVAAYAAGSFEVRIPLSEINK